MEPCNKGSCYSLRMEVSLCWIDWFWIIGFFIIPSPDSSFITTTPARPTPRKDANAMNVTTLSWHSSMNDSNRNLTSSCWNINQLSPQRLSMNNSFGNNVSRQNVRSNTSMNVSGNLSQPNSPSMSFSSPYKYSNGRGEIIADEKDIQQYLKWVFVQRDMSSSKSTDFPFLFLAGKLNSRRKVCRML